MSRLDDFEYPPGLGFARSSAEREHALHHSTSGPLGGFGLPDRRAALNGMGYSSYNLSPSLPRSNVLQEHDFGVGANDAWSPVGITPSAIRQSSATSSQLHHIPPFNHHHHRSSPPSLPPSGPSPYIGANGTGAASANLLNGLYTQTPYPDRDRDAFLPRPTQSAQISAHSPSNSLSLNPDSYAARSTLWWGGLEAWMDEEYAKQVCGLMGWNPTEIRVPHPPPDPATGQQANNPGYCFLTFTSPGQAASVLGQMNSGSNGPMLMPNSNKPFVLNWASNVPSSSLTPSYPAPSAVPTNGQRYEKEYSIFVGDLPPEASNSDLVAVFRNPVLGLRNDREPKFVRPFLSCKSAKIMLDPVTGVSRGYGFVRFTDEADQQRALVEMHGLYCLSRPMRISPATAKFKPPPSIPGAPVQFPPASPNGHSQPQQGVTVTLPLPTANPVKSVSAPIASTINSSSSESTPSVSHASVTTSASTSATSLNSLSTPSLSSGTSSGTSLSSLSSAPSEDMLRMIAQFANGSVSSNGTKSASAPLNSITAPFAIQSQDQSEAAKYHLSEESWKHHAQARAILSNLIGPNGEQLTSSDPYNTTVFVGGLSPLISEETLRTFFAPFGDIHYVKVPVGKHCGFVQFVHKKDAERAIEKMQGFPIGGSRIRLSWGRSQYKAAQAAAQAAQAAALQAQIQSQAPQQADSVLTPDQAIQLLQKFGFTAFLNNPSVAGAVMSENSTNGFANSSVNGVPGTTNEDTAKTSMNSMTSSTNDNNGAAFSFDRLDSAAFALRADTSVPPSRSSFSPFSPDPNLFPEELRRRDSLTPSRAEPLPHPSKNYAPGFGPSPLQTQDINGLDRGTVKRVSPITPTSSHPNRPSVSRFNSFLGGPGSAFDATRTNSRASFHEQEQPKEADVHEHDLIHDLNGTLASLDLDNNQGSWRAHEERSGGRMSSSPGRSSHQ